MENLVGRMDEKKILRNALLSPGAELIAVYGRRSVGKTFLIRSIYEKHLAFEFTGVHNAKMQEQLEGFSFALKEAMKIPVDLAAPISWASAFHLLENFMISLLKKQKKVIFFDEFPWIHTQKSNFLRAFEHFWKALPSSRAFPASPAATPVWLQ